MFKVDAADYMLSICGNDALRELSSPGKSGSFFYLTHDDKYMIKTMKKSEVKVSSATLPLFISWIFHHLYNLICYSQITQNVTPTLIYTCNTPQIHATLLYLAFLYLFHHIAHLFSLPPITRVSWKLLHPCTSRTGSIHNSVPILPGSCRTCPTFNYPTCLTCTGGNTTIK